jgi:hypothetical protein
MWTPGPYPCVSAASPSVRAPGDSHSTPAPALSLIDCGVPGHHPSASQLARGGLKRHGLVPGVVSRLAGCPHGVELSAMSNFFGHHAPLRALNLTRIPGTKTRTLQSGPKTLPMTRTKRSLRTAANGRQCRRICSYAENPDSSLFLHTRAGPRAGRAAQIVDPRRIGRSTGVRTPGGEPAGGGRTTKHNE